MEGAATVLWNKVPVSSGSGMLVQFLPRHIKPRVATYGQLMALTGSAWRLGCVLESSQRIAEPTYSWRERDEIEETERAGGPIGEETRPFVQVMTRT